MPSWTFLRRHPYTGERAILFLRFLCRKGLCRQRQELGSKCNISFPIQRTRVTRVTRDVLFHRFTRRCLAMTHWERYTKHAKLKRCRIWPEDEPNSIHGWFKRTRTGNQEPCQDSDKSERRGTSCRYTNIVTGDYSKRSLRGNHTPGRVCPNAERWRPHTS